MRRVLLGILSASVFLGATASEAQRGKAATTVLVSHDVYRMPRAGLLVLTTACSANARGEPAALRTEAGQRFLWFFDTQTRCDVSAAYRVNARTRGGAFTMKLDRVADDLYQEFGRRQFLRTSGCSAEPTAEEVRIELRDGGSGRLVFKDGRSCRVEGVYSELAL